MVLGECRQTRNRLAPASARIVKILIILVGLGPVAILALQNEHRSEPRVVANPLSDDAARLLREYWPDSRDADAGPEIVMGDLIDSFIDWKPSARNPASILDYAVARARGNSWSGINPEDTSRRLFSLANELEQNLWTPTDSLLDPSTRTQNKWTPTDSTAPPKQNNWTPTDSTGRHALALLARYHARKILCGLNLALFYQSGDTSALDTATSHAMAGLAIWERLVRLADTQDVSLALIPAGGANGFKDAIPFVRHDIARLEEVRRIFERYGLFDRGLDFGPQAVQDVGPRKSSRARSYALERRFLPLEPGLKYSQQNSYGWLSTEGIDASPALPIPDFGYREGRSNPLRLPSDALTVDFLRGRAQSTLLLDIPDGSYRVTAILANQAELASGSFCIRTLEKNSPAEALSYAAGETGDKSMNAAVAAGRLELEFVPEPGKDWLLNGLVVTRRAPHIGHVPIPAVNSASATVFTATITAPDGIYSADLHLAVKKWVSNLSMVQDGAQFAARVRWLPSWSGTEATYYITALDRAGHSARWPPAGSFRIRILAKDESQDRPGRAVHNLLIQSSLPCNP